MQQGSPVQSCDTLSLTYWTNCPIEAVMQTNLTWQDVDAVAAELGVTIEARRKWRQRPPGVPYKLRIQIFEALRATGREIDFSAFDELARPNGAAN